MPRPRWCGPRSCTAGPAPRPRSPPTSPRRHSPTRARPSSIWRDSPLQVAVESVEAELRRTAEDGDLVLAVTDAETRILWTYGGRVMRRKAETVNFVRRRALDDESVGTNALDLANRAAEAVDGVQRRALRLDRAQLGLLGGAGARPGQRPPARRHRPVDDLGPHPPDRARDRPGDGPADRDGPAALAHHPSALARRRHRRPRPGDDAARHRRGAPRRPAAAAQPPPDRGAGAARAAPRGALARPAARAASTATRRSRSPRSRPRCRTCARRSAASSPRGPTGC